MAIGVDIEDIERFKGKSDAFLDRVFTPLELEYCNKFNHPESHLAARFCAKEAVVKGADEKLSTAHKLSTTGTAIAGNVSIKFTGFYEMQGTTIVAEVEVK